MRLGFRGALLALLLGVLALTSVLVGGSANYNARFAVEDLGRQLMEQAAGRIQQYINAVLDVAVSQGAINAFMIESHALRPDDHVYMTQYFLGAMRANPSLTYLSWASNNGAYWHVFRDKNGELLVQWILPNATGGFDLTDYRPHADGTFEQIFSDPNTKRANGFTRPYYVAARDAKKATWPETYIFLGMQGSFDIPGLTRANPVYANDGTLLGVLTADFDLFALSRYLEQIPIGEAGFAFLMEMRADGTQRLIAHPDAPEKLDFTIPSADGKGRESPRADEVSDARVRALVAQMSARADIPSQIVPTRFEADGTLYIGGFQRLDGVDRPHWVLALVVPEAEVLGRVNAMTRAMIGVAFAGVLVVVLLSLWVATRLSRPLHAIADETRSIAKFELAPRPLTRSPIAEINRLGRAMEDMKASLRSFQKYVPSELVRTILASGKEAQLGGERRRITLYFSDVAGFTGIAESLDPDVLVDLLAEYLDVMTREMLAQGATVDKYIGDAIMAFWGAPHSMEDQALRACRTALMNRDALEVLGKKWIVQGKPVLRARIGLHTGEALVGNFGSPDRLVYTAIGDNVNLASRLEGLNKAYGTTILMSEDTYNEVKQHIVARQIDRVAVKGRSRGTRVYELIGMRGQVTDAIRDRIERYEAALELYFSRRFEVAAAAFEALAALGDVPARVLAARSRAYIQNPPPDDWDGVYLMESK